MNNINVFLYSYDDFETHGPIVSSDIGVNNINKDALDECTYDIWRKVYRDKIDFNPNVVYLKNIEEDTKKLHNENQKYNLYCKIVQVDGFLGSAKIADIKVNFDNKEDKILHRNTGFHNCVYPYDIEKSFFGLFKSSWPTWILEDLESGNCKIILHNILEEFMSLGLDSFFRTMQHQLKELGIKEKWITIVDSCRYDKEYVDMLDTEIKFVYSNLILGFYIENFYSEQKKENLPNVVNTDYIREKYYLSMSRNKKLFRAFVVYQLWKNNLLDKGNVSIFKNVWIENEGSWQELMDNSLSRYFQGWINADSEDENRLSDKVSVKEFFDWWEVNNLEIDTHQKFEENHESYPAPGHSQTKFSKETLYSFQNSYFHLVSCNYYDGGYAAGKNLYLDDKMFPAILHFLPFILVGTSGLLNELKLMGFKTFHPHIDESYDMESDDIKRMKMIVNETKRLCGMSKEEIHNWYCEMKDILQYNYDFYFDKFLPLQVNNFYNEFLLEG